MDTGLNNRNYLHEVFENKDFEDVEWLIEANSNEQHQIWKNWHKRLDWQQITHGYGMTIKNLNCEGETLPLTISFSFVKVNGHKIAFYYCCSLLSHSGYVEAFLLTYFQRTHDGYTRWNHTDSQNEHNCLNYLDTIDAEPRNTIYAPSKYDKKYFCFPPLNGLAKTNGL